MTWTAVAPLLGLLAIIAFIYWLIRRMAAQAVSGAAAAAEALGLAPKGGGFEGMVDGVPLQIFANHVVPRDAVPSRLVAPVPSMTGEILVAARLRTPLEPFFLLESTAAGGRGHRDECVRTGDAVLDDAFSLVTGEAKAMAMLLHTPGVRSALLELRDKLVCLVEVDAFQVTVHSAHHDRTVELAHDAARLALRLEEAARAR